MTAGSQSLKWTCQTRSRNSRTAATGSPPAPKVQCPVSRHSPSIDGVGHVEQAPSLRLGLDQGSDVLVDHRPDPGLVHDLTGDRLAPSANTCHCSAVMLSDGPDAPGDPGAVGVAVRVVAEDDDALRAADACQLLRGTHGVLRADSRWLSGSWSRTLTQEPTSARRRDVELRRSSSGSVGMNPQSPSSVPA